MYKTPKFLGYVLYERPSIKYVPSEYWSFIHLIPLVCLDTLSMPQFPTTCVCFLPSPATKKIKEILLFHFLPEKKFFFDFPLFWQSRKSWQPRRVLVHTLVKHNVWTWTYFWALVGTIFFGIAQTKTKLKKVLSQTFF